MDTGDSQNDALAGTSDVPSSNGHNHHINEHRRIAYCECGAQIAGDSEQELFDAAQRHVAHHHPQLLGALQLEVVSQMAEDVGGH
jgi:predicted small metal-binding protein